MPISPSRMAAGRGCGAGGRKPCPVPAAPSAPLSPSQLPLGHCTHVLPPPSPRPWSRGQHPSHQTQPEPRQGTQTTFLHWLSGELQNPRSSLSWTQGGLFSVEGRKIMSWKRDRRQGPPGDLEGVAPGQHVEGGGPRGREQRCPSMPLSPPGAPELSRCSPGGLPRPRTRGGSSGPCPWPRGGAADGGRPPGPGSFLPVSRSHGSGHQRDMGKILPRDTRVAPPDTASAGSTEGILSLIHI